MLPNDYLQILNDRPIHQSQSWADFQKSLGKDIIWINDILIIKFPLPFGFCWLLCSKLSKNIQDPIDFIKQIKKIAKAEKAVWIRFENPEIEIEQILPNESFHETNQSYLPKTTLILDLSLSLEELLSQMKPKGRYHIRLAEKKELQIESYDYQDTNLKEKTDAFYQILLDTAKRNQFGIHSAEHYLKLLTALQNNAKLYLAKHNDEYIAGLIATYSGDTVTYYYGASSNSHRELKAPYLLQWEAIKDAKNNGYKIYDFLGIESEQNAKTGKLAGVTEFKTKFGGIEINYPDSKILIFKPVFFGLIEMAKKLLKLLSV